MLASAASPYSEESLRSLQQLLEVHGALLWVDPTTNTLTAKRSIPLLHEEELQAIDVLQE